MWRVFIRSRSGNVALGLVGAIYTLLAVGVLWRYIAEFSNAAGILDRLFQATLIGAAICGIWFVMTALANLGIRLGHHDNHRPHNARR